MFEILLAAKSILQRVKYSIGEEPTISLNLRAKIDRDLVEVLLA